MTEEHSAVNDNSMAQPTIEGSHPEGGGVGSGSEAGGNKRDAISSSPTIGRTIAGRDINTGASSDISNAGRQPPPAPREEDREPTGSPDTNAKGVTGTSGK